MRKSITFFFCLCATLVIQAQTGFTFASKSDSDNLNKNASLQTQQPSATFKNAVIIWPEIKLKATLGTLSSTTKIKFNDAMTHGLDPGYDAGIMKSGFDLYTRLVEDNGIDFTIQCLPLVANEEMEIPVGLESSTAGTVTFSVELSNLPANCRVSFEDRVTGTFTPLTQNGTICTLVVAAQSKTAGRFFLHTSTKVGQDITLSAGWNIISANVLPSNLNMKDIFQTLINAGALKKVMDESGKTIENFGAFGGWKNNIGNLTVTKGYKVNMISASTLSIQGIPVNLPLDIALNTGWNIISYPSTSPQDAKALVQSLIDAGKLKKVMDESGKTIENFGAFGGWKNNIGNFVPGKGYKVNVLDNCTLTIPATSTKAATIVPEVLASTHFTKVFAGNGTDHESINLVNLQASGLQAGDEIGVFDGKLCVGSATIGTEQLMAGSISIPASANDEISEAANGFTSGHSIELKLYHGGLTYTLALANLEGQDIFDKNASLFAQVSRTDATGITGFDNKISFRCYPNPFSEQVTIEIQSDCSEKLEVNIFDMNGKLVRKLYNGQARNQGILIWDGRTENESKAVSGTYLINANGKIAKVVLKD